MNKSRSTFVIAALRIRWIARIGSTVSIWIMLLSSLAIAISSISTAWQDWVSYLTCPIGVTIGLIIAKWHDGVGGAIATASGLAFYGTYYLLGGTITDGKEFAVVLPGMLASPGILFLAFWLLMRRRPEIADCQNGPEFETTSGKSGVRHWIMSFMKGHFGITSFLVIVVGGSYVTDFAGRWDSSDGTPPPSHLKVLRYYEALDVVSSGSYLLRELSVDDAPKHSNPYTYLLPWDGKRVRLKHGDGSYSVVRLSEHEQIVTVNYEYAMASDGESIYRATDQTIEPIAADIDSIFDHLIPFLAWLVVMSLRVIVTVFMLLTQKYWDQRSVPE